MRSNMLKTALIKSGLAASVLLLASGASFGQQVINLSAGPTTLTGPDGNVVPMWGYTCGALAGGTTTATCAALNPASVTTAATATAAATGTWSPVVITVPYTASAPGVSTTSLTINLTNNLTFTPTSATTANTIPTSLVIVGQLGGGLGCVAGTTTATCPTGATSTASPTHNSAYVTWSTVSAAPVFTPPSQGNRVQSFATEVAAAGATLVTGQVASGSSLTWNGLRPGTYLIESGTHPSIQGPMGLYGILVVTQAPATAGASGTAYPAGANATTTPAIAYNAEVPLLFSEVDAVQNKAVDAAVRTAGFSETTVWSGQPGGCGNPGSATYQQCYPPAVNYTPTYFAINGVEFDKTHATASVFPATAGVTTTGITGTVLVRMVNAGLRMHLPSIVGAQTAGVNGAGAAATVNGFTLIAEDGNPVPGAQGGKPRVQSDVFMAAGKTYDVMVNAPTPPTGATAPSLAVYDRELSLSGDAINRDAGMLAYIGVNGSGVPASSAIAAAVARNDVYNAVVSGQTLVVSDPSKGVIANDTNVYGVTLVGTVPGLTLNPNGTFSYTGAPTLFTYCANGTVTAGVCSSGVTATVALNAATIEASTGITCVNPTFNSTMATYIAVKTPGVLSGCKDAAGYPLTVDPSTVTGSGVTVVADANGGFTASATGAGTYTFSFQAKNSQGTLGAVATATVNFPTASNLQVTVLDGYDKTTVISDYRWIIEEDKTFYVDPTKSANTGATCTGAPGSATCPVVPTLGVNFHTSHMGFVAQGCTGTLSCESGQAVFDPVSGTHLSAACDVGNGLCRTTAAQKTIVMPSQVALDPTKRYYISVLPGDAANPFYGASATGHGMGGAPIGIDPYTHVQQSAVTVLSQPSPYPAAELSVFVFEDDFPLNGEHDAGGAGVSTTGADTLAPNEAGLGGFQIHLWDAYAGNGDFTGQITTDMFNQPLTNKLDGTIDPLTGFNACPITVTGLAYPGTNATDGNPATSSNAATTAGITGQVVTCPKYESDQVTLSPLAGQAVISNLYPGRWGVIVTPGADHIARGEEWLQTNTLDGQKAHDAFTRIGEPSYFQEFGPASFHVSVGFANPAIINARLAGVCNGTDINITGPNCNQDPTKGTVHPGNTVIGRVTSQRLSRTPDERLYSSGSHDAFAWTQCFASVGDPDGEDFAFTKCDADGNFSFTGLPDGDWRITTFDQWNDQLVDGLSTPVRLSLGATGGTTNMGDIAATQWEANLYTRTFVDDNQDGISQAAETGIPFNNVAVRLRDGSLGNLLLTDFTGTANFNETFPLFSWYTVETDVTRYKNTGTHVVYDAGGPADGTPCGGTSGYPPCGNSTIGHFLANTVEMVSLPTSLRVPGALYCADADCSTHPTGIVAGSGASDPPSVCTTTSTGATTCSTTLSTGRIDPPWVGVEGWQGFPGQQNFVEFGKTPYVPGENGGIKGHVIYASTRPFDDPQQLVQTQWEPLVPNVTINLYQEGLAADGVTKTLKLVDTTQTSSWDDWAQGFRADGVTPNMNCPGQGAATGANPDLFFFSLQNQPNYLDVYNNQHSGSPLHTLPYNSQFKCYDGMHNWNQIQPAPYDGMYKFPSVTAVDSSGKPNATYNSSGIAISGTNCTICTADPAVAPDLYAGIPMLPAGKYVVEVVLPPGYELVKEEDKNILIGDNFIAPVAQEFGGLGIVTILPDQASVAGTVDAGSGYNANATINGVLQNPTQSFGTIPSNGIVPGFVPEPTWPCVGEARIVPDYISLFPASKQVSPFAGAKRNLCDRKEVTLGDQSHSIAKFFIYTSTHIASKFTGGITDDYTSEFDPFSPQFGEKFAPPDLPVSVKDWTGAEILRTYADHWGAYDGMTYSTWEVNVPNPTGYGPTVMVMCMNDPGPILDTNPASLTVGQMITDPLFTQGYSQFCYEIPFMPGATAYLDTPVVPTSAFAGAGYNNVDCAYPALTPAIKEVDGDGIGPWVSAAGNSITITALGDTMVPNNAYSGPSATTAPWNQKTILRHYGFGGTKGTVTIGGVPVPASSISTWTDGSIVLSVPSGVPNCTVQQQAIYGGSTAQCGELVITTSTGQQSIDTVTVTIGGSTPTHVAASASIQAAIDAANPGDLIMIDPTCTAGTCATGTAATNSAAAHNELLLMWKPVRLQGVGAASSVINANTHPAGKMDPWRRQVDCLFGIAINGQPISGVNGQPLPATNVNLYDATGKFTCPATMQFTVDRLPLESVLGWDATVNGNLAELLQEPSLMGALEGAGITVLSKGVKFPAGVDPFGSNTATPASFPDGTTLLTTADCGTTTNPYPSNFLCNPSSIDGLGITNSSQGGGGIFVHAWGHNIQIANNRIYNNAGTLGGGINVGQGEFPSSYIQGSTTNAVPGSCETSPTAGVQLPYCQYMNVNVHNNAVMLNSATGDELFSATPAGAGGVNFCTGADYYKFQYNWVCGNLSSGDGGGFGHLGFSKNGDIEHNTFLFNQSLNPTIPANGGAMIIMGTPDADPTCSAANDADCVPPPGSISPSDGIGPGMVINANLIMGNAAEAGSGGGIAFQSVNGSEVLAFPNTPSQWYHVLVTNNVIADNVAGWDGGGVSLLDALNVDLINNTIVNNNTTASAGVLNNTLGAPLASTQNTGNNCSTNCGTASLPQVAGVVSIQNSAVLAANINQLTGTTKVTCPAGHYAGSSGANGTCMSFSYPLLANDVIYHNAAFQIGVGQLSPQFQQNVVTLYNASFTGGLGAALTAQTYTGQCVSGSQYWDLGVRGDTGPTNHATGVTLAPTYSLLSSTAGYTAGNNTSLATTWTAQYCDGSRQPPEFGGSGWAVPAGIADATVPNPLFNLTPVATVDEGNNWINLRWGPLTAVAPTTTGPNTAGNLLANYTPASGSAIGAIPAAVSHPFTDFNGNLRPDPTDPSHFDIGAIEVNSVAPAPAYNVSPTTLTFNNTVVTSPPSQSAAQSVTVNNTGNVPLTSIAVAFSPTNGRFARSTATPGNCGISVGTATQPLNPGASCTIGIAFTPTAVSSTPVTGTATVTGTSLASTVTVGTVSLSGTAVAAVRSVTFTPTTWSAGNTPRGISATSAPTQTFTLQNTGNVPVTNVVQGALSGDTADFTVNRIASTCGPAGNGQAQGITSLAVGAVGAPGTFCVITVRFVPPTTATLGAKAASVSVTDSVGTQTSSLSGTVVGATLTISAPALNTGTTTTHTGLITVSNTATGATAGPFSFTAAPSIAKVGTAGGTFSIVAGGTPQCTATTVVAPGGSCQINVQYAPGAAGTTTATANVTVTGSGLGTASQTSSNFTAN